MNKYINKIYLGDCLDVMNELPDNCIDLVLTDPPYGVRKKEEWDDLEYFENNLKIWLDECLRISNKVLWFCADKMLPLILNNRYKQFNRLLIWNKPPGSQFAGASNNNIWYSLEPILYFGENEADNKEKKYYYSCFNYRTRILKEAKHPTAKPMGLIINLLDCFSKESDLIFDGFAGSGTTALACIELNRRFICVEKDLDYYNIAKKRIEDAQSQLKLF